MHGMKRRGGEEHSMFAALQMHLTEGISTPSLSSSWNWGFGVSLFGFRLGFFPTVFLNPGIFMFPAQVAVSESLTTGSSF